MNEIIEKLKDKNYVRAFGLMKLEEQEVYRKIKIENCLVYYGGSSFSPISECFSGFIHSNTYAIKPDYQPEPEYMDIEIEEDDERLGIWDKGNFIPLHCLPSRSNFEGFYELMSDEKKIPLLFKNVSKEISKRNVVYARFRNV